MLQPTVEVRNGQRRLYLDVETNEWVIEFGDEGNTIARHADKSVIEALLKRADNEQ